MLKLRGRTELLPIAFICKDRMNASRLAMFVSNPMPHSGVALLKIDQQGTRSMPEAWKTWLNDTPVGRRTARRLEMAAISASGWLWQGICPVTSCLG